MKENDVSFNKITPLLKLTEEQIHLKARYFAQEIRPLRTSSKMFLERIKSVNDEEQMMLEQDINNIRSKAIAQGKTFDSLDLDSPNSFNGKNKKAATMKYLMKRCPVMIRQFLSIYSLYGTNMIYLLKCK